MYKQPKYMENFEARWRAQHPNDTYLPPFLCGPMNDERALYEMKMMAAKGDFDFATSGGQKETLTSVANCIREVESQKPEMPFWIAISGYPLARAYLVYRFFSDIGRIMDRSFTKTNSMYLKYYSIQDCQIALSYNGRRIGYGSDLEVTVWQEDPLEEPMMFVVAEEDEPDEVELENEPMDESALSYVIDIELEKVNADVSQAKEEPLPEQQIAPKRRSILQWLKEKLSYMFYFY